LLGFIGQSVSREKQESALRATRFDQFCKNDLGLLSETEFSSGVLSDPNQ
jgi:hypothetical protein